MAAFLVLPTSSLLLPHRIGRSGGVGPQSRWFVSRNLAAFTMRSEDGPPLLWESKGGGRGYSSMSSVGGMVYTVGDTPSTENSGRRRIRRLFPDVALTAKLIWKSKLGHRYEHSNKQWESSRSTPTIDGDWLYVLTGNGEIICLKMGQWAGGLAQESPRRFWRQERRCLGFQRIGANRRRQSHLHPWRQNHDGRFG